MGDAAEVWIDPFFDIRVYRSEDAAQSIDLAML